MAPPIGLSDVDPYASEGDEDAGSRTDDPSGHRSGAAQGLLGREVPPGSGPGSNSSTAFMQPCPKQPQICAKRATLRWRRARSWQRRGSGSWMPGSR